MDQFRIVIEGRARNGCDRRAKPGDRLTARCSLLSCPDCLMLDFVQLLRQKGMRLDVATFIHEPDSSDEVVDDALINKRVSGRLTPTTGVSAQVIVPVRRSE